MTDPLVGLLAPPAVYVHYRHFAGAIAHPLLFVLQTLRVFAIHRNIILTTIIFRISQSQ